MPLSDEKRKSIQKLADSFKKDHGLEDSKGTTIGFLSDNLERATITRLKSGVVPFDLLTGGGWVKGRINQIYGPEGSTKSTLMLNTIAYNQKNTNDFLATYLNNENTLDIEYANFIGINPDELILGQFTTNEDAADYCNKIADPETGVDLAAFDTIQALSCEGELIKGTKEKSVKDNTMGLIPRVYSQFLRMYTSKSIGSLTLLLGSQVRLDLGSFFVTAKPTGGNAIKHYNMLTVEVAEAGKGEWPVTDIPPKSFPVRMKIQKSKLMNRYRGCSIIGYFYNGSFDRKFNVVAISKDLGLHDGKSLEYVAETETKEFKARGIMDMYNRIPDEAVNYLESKLNEAYEKSISTNKEKVKNGEED